MSRLSAEQLASVTRTIRKAVKQRNTARAQQRFDVADEIRSALEDLGVTVTDNTATTSTWQWKSAPVVVDDDDDERPPAKKKKRRRDEEPAPTEPAPEPEAKPAAPASIKLEGGLVAKILKEGKGAAARPRQTLRIKYKGVLAATKRQFDAGTIAFVLGAGEVVRGWDLGCVGMRVGEKRRLVIPPKLGYGARGAPPDIPKNATLVFDLTLLTASS